MAYATLEQTNIYVSSFYSSTDTISITWEALQDEDKQVQLNRAEQFIDLLPFNGPGVSLTKAFPREPNKELSLIRAKEATMELAIRLVGDVANIERYSLRSQGVKSYKIGDLSETFMDISGYAGMDNYVYETVFPFLKDWLGGGYRIKAGHANCKG